MTYILKSSKLDILESGDFPVLPVWWDMMPLLPFEGNIEPQKLDRKSVGHVDDLFLLFQSGLFYGSMWLLFRDV